MHRSARQRTLVALALAMPLLCGCQAGVMIGRILFGDPEQPSALEASTDIRLDEQDLPTYIVCTSPSITTTKYETLAIDLPDELNRRLRRREIATGDPSDAMNAAADYGSQFDIYEVAKELDPGYLVHVDFEQFSLSEDNGNTLMRGRANGTVSIFEIRDPDDGQPTHAVEIFRRGFESAYPRSHPVPVDQTPEKVFRKRFISHLADETGRMLYRYRMSDMF